MTQHVILFLAANPGAADELPLREKIATIERGLARARHRADFQFVPRLAVTVDELIPQLNELAPTVIHFSGHGGDENGFVVQDERGQQQPLSARALATIVGVAASGARLIVLDGCYTAAHAEMLRAKVDCVVGVASSIGEDAARAFLAIFYGALANNTSIGKAVDLGAAALAVRELPDEALPRCLTREGVDKYHVFPCPGRPHDNRDAEASPDDYPVEGVSGRNVVAVIGVDVYSSNARWPRLRNAVSDAEGVAALFEQLGFVQLTGPLIGAAATGDAIEALVTDTLANLLGDNDTLVLFYAGHGGNRKRSVGRRDITAGYLIPVDADDRVATWVDLEGWLRHVAMLSARHILVILDACHSGIALDPVNVWRGKTSEEPLATLRARPSRRIIASAHGNELAMDSGPLPGHSLFTGCLIEGLTHELRRGGRQVATGSELGLYLQQRVVAYPGSRQTPDFGAFFLDDRGELVLPLGRATAPTTTPPTPIPVSEPLSWATASGHDQYGRWAVFNVQGVQHRMRWIPPGQFLMGSPPTEIGRWNDEAPQHEVTITQGYWLGETPVTQALWVALMGKNPSGFRGDRPEDLERPVERVSWDDCQMFIERLNRRGARLTARLPSEAEWELACRAETTTATWINQPSKEDEPSELEAIAWYDNISGGKTHPVGRKAPNPYGLFDMLGNVSEWCQDAADDCKGHPYMSAPAADPVPPSQGRYRVYRGGSWYDSRRYLRAASRFAYPRDYRGVDLGFRLAGGS